jgi:hypothetical protein
VLDNTAQGEVQNRRTDGQHQDKRQKQFGEYAAGHRGVLTGEGSWRDALPQNQEV